LESAIPAAAGRRARNVGEGVFLVEGSSTKGATVLLKATGSSRCHLLGIGRDNG
jgi:hypothetical protein